MSQLVQVEVATATWFLMMGTLFSWQPPLHTRKTRVTLPLAVLSRVVMSYNWGLLWCPLRVFGGLLVLMKVGVVEVVFGVSC